MLVVVVGFAFTQLSPAISDWAALWFANVVSLLAAALAGVACLAASRRHEGRRSRGWAYMGASCLSWALGTAIWIYYLNMGEELPFPSLADVAYLATIPLAALSVQRLPATTSHRGSGARDLLDGITVAASLLLISWGTALGTVYRGSEDDVWTLALSLAYPVGDLALVTIVVIILSRDRSRSRGPLVLIAVGLVAVAVADSGFAYLTQIDGYAGAEALDTSWVAGFLLIGLAALWPVPLGPAPREAARDAPALWQVLLPYGAVGGALVTGTAIGLARGGLDVFMVFNTLVIVVAVFGRQVLTIVQNVSLAHQLEATIADLEDRERRLAHEALHDSLTGLANRALFADRVDHAVVGHRRSGRHVALLFCDLDGFKAVNDTFGHAAGDVLLIEVADRLRRCVRASDTVARLGGDEFAVLLEGTDGLPRQALAVASRISASLREPVALPNKELSTQASVGVAISQGTEIDGAHLLHDADVAMYQAKAKGDGGVVVFRESMRQEAQHRSDVEVALRSALGRGELRLYYQPVVSIVTGAATGFEALARWDHPELGIIPPAEFIDVAEDTGLITPIGAWVLEEATRQLAAWHAAGAVGLTMAVNVSARQLRSPHLVRQVASILQASGVAPADLCLEVTESVLLDDTDASIDVLTGLKQLGVQIAIDDFGTRYSSLSYLRRLPVDVIKIDRSFVNELGTTAESTAIVTAVIHLARALNLTTVAEGVETAEQRLQLQALGCELAQGYLFARPAPPDRLESWIVAGPAVPPPRPVPSGAEPATGPYRVLIVDDDAMDRAMMTRILERTERFTVVGEAANGYAAIELAQQERPDLVLLDVTMPAMDGIQAFPEILSTSPDTKIVLFSGSRPPDQDDMVPAGAAAYLSKSISPDRLIEEMLLVVGAGEGPDGEAPAGEGPAGDSGRPRRPAARPDGVSVPR